jgi:hypothetical protein
MGIIRHSRLIVVGLVLGCVLAAGQTLLNLPVAKADQVTTLGLWNMSDGSRRQAYEVQWRGRPDIYVIERVRGTNVDSLVPTRGLGLTNALDPVTGRFEPAVWLIDLLPIGQVAGYRLRTLSESEYLAMPGTNRAVHGAICVLK